MAEDITPKERGSLTKQIQEVFSIASGYASGLQTHILFSLPGNTNTRLVQFRSEFTYLYHISSHHKKITNSDEVQLLKDTKAWLFSKYEPSISYSIHGLNLFYEYVDLLFSTGVISYE